MRDLLTPKNAEKTCCLRTLALVLLLTIANVAYASDFEGVKSDGSLVELDASNFGTKRNDLTTCKSVIIQGTWNATQMKNVFESIRGTNVLETVDMSGLTTDDDNLNMSNSLATSSALTKIIFPTKPHTITGLFTAFTSCVKLIDLVNFENQKFAEKGVSFYRAFDDCQALKNVTLPVGGYVSNMSAAFKSCTALESVGNFDKLISVGDGVIMSSCFESCKGLKNIVFPNQSEGGAGFKVSALNGVAQFSSLVNVDMSGIVGSGSMEYAFRQCPDLEQVILPNEYFTITSLANAFIACPNLRKVDNFNKLISSSSGVSMSSCFYGCSVLESVDIPANFKVSSLAGAFRTCNKLSEVDLTNIVGVDAGVSMFYAFEKSFNIAKIILPENLFVSSCEYTFSGCTALKYIVNLEKLTAKSGLSMTSMFSGCSSLVSVALPASGVENASSLSSTFNSCYLLEKIDNLPKVSLAAGKSIENMFNSCYSLTQVEFGNGVADASRSTTCFGSANPNIVKVLPVGTTDISKIQANFGANVCAKTADGEAILLSDNFLIERSIKNNSIPARYYSTYNIDLNGKKAIYRDMTPNYVSAEPNSVKWNTIMCPFTPTTFTLNKTKAALAHENANLTVLSKSVGMKLVRVATFWNKYEDVGSEIRAIFGYVRCYEPETAYDYMRANVPYIYEVSESAPVEFISANATETVQKTETLFYNKDVTAGTARSLADPSTTIMGGYNGSMPILANMAYLSSDCQNFVVPQSGKWDTAVYGADYMYNGDMFIDSDARIWIPQDIQTAIETPESDPVNIIAVAGGLKVVGAKDKVYVYGINGLQVYSGNDEFISLSAGLYIVKTAAHVHKVVVK